MSKVAVRFSMEKPIIKMFDVDATNADDAVRELSEDTESWLGVVADAVELEVMDGQYDVEEIEEESEAAEI
jgi:hypothetical protein